MTPPTRLERLVKQARAGYVSKFLSPEQCVGLLRREQAYQLARVRRIVKAQPHYLDKIMNLINRDDLLQALRKGTR